MKANFGQRSDVALISPLVISGLVWLYLSHHPGKRPRVAQMAAAAGVTERQLRRQWKRENGSMSLRRAMSNACVCLAGVLMSHGVKPDAAIRLAGLHSRWNFNRQCRRLGRGTARNCGGDDRWEAERRAVLHALAECQSLHRFAVEGRAATGPLSEVWGSNGEQREMPRGSA
jgi:hypothetical protein